MQHRHHRLVALLGVAAAAGIALSACSSGSTPGQSQAASTSAAPTSAAPTSAAPTSAAPTSAAPTSAAPTSAAPTTAAPTTAAPTSAAPTTDAPAAGGKTYGPGDKLPALDLAKLPKSFGEFKQTTATNTGGNSFVQYEDAKGGQYSITGPLGSAATDLSESIDSSRTEVGAGLCGTSTTKTNFVCYLQLEKGSISITADGGWSRTDGSKVALKDVLAFVTAFEGSIG